MLVWVSQLMSYFTLLTQNSLILTCQFNINLVSLKVDQISSHQNTCVYLFYKLLRFHEYLTKSQAFKVARHCFTN